MKIISIGADISKNDTYCSNSLIKNLENSLNYLSDIGAEHAALTNITGDDVVISAMVEEELVETINQGIVKILKENAEDLGDIEGISAKAEDAGEGISYAEAKIRQDRFPDAVIMAFDTYGGEEFVGEVANYARSAALGMKGVTDVSAPVGYGPMKIPGVGYVSDQTDDPVVIATIEDLESVGSAAGAMLGAALGSKNVYLVKRGAASHVIPGSVITTLTAYMNGNILDLAVPLAARTRILGV